MGTEREMAFAEQALQKINKEWLRSLYLQGEDAWWEREWK